MTNYDLWAPVYDTMYQFDHDYPKYLAQARKCGLNAKILSLCCGTGRIMLKLAEEGFNVWGVDISAGMLSKAEQKKKKLSPNIAKRVHFIQANTCNVELPEKFDMAYFAFLSFLHLTSMEDQLAGLRNVRNHLKDNGVLLIEIVQPNFTHFSKQTHETTIRTPVPETRHEIFSRRVLYFNHTLSLIYEDFFDKEFDEFGNFVRGGHRYLTGCYIMRTEMHLLLQMTGFIVEEVLEKKRNNPHEQDSGFLTFVCRKSDKIIPVEMPIMSSSINHNQLEPYYQCACDFKEDIPFYLKQASQFKEKNIDILILKDFNHRLAFQLVKAGHSIVEYGIINRSSVKGEQVSFELGRMFDLIIIPKNVFSSWFSLQEQLEVLKSCKKHLKKTSEDKQMQSKLIIDNFILQFEQLSKQNRRSYENCIFKDDKKEIFSTRFEQYEYRDQIIKYNNHYEEYTLDGAFKEKYKHEGRCRWFYKNEIELLLRIAGFTAKIYSSYELIPYNYESGKILIIASVV